MELSPLCESSAPVHGGELLGNSLAQRPRTGLGGVEERLAECGVCRRPDEVQGCEVPALGVCEVQIEAA